MIFGKGTDTETWALSFGGTSFVPTTDPKNPFTPLQVAVTEKGSRLGTEWSRVALGVKTYFLSTDRKAQAIREMGEIKMVLNPQFRSSTQTDELFQYLPKGAPSPGMNLPQIAYGGPPLEPHLYPVGGTSMNYVRNLLEYLVSKGLLKDSSENKVDSIPRKFNEEFNRYHDIWTTCWGDTKEGKEIVAVLRHVLGTS